MGIYSQVNTIKFNSKRVAEMDDEAWANNFSACLVTFFFFPSQVVFLKSSQT